MKKTGYQNDNLPNLGRWFNWGLNVENVKDLFFVTGHADVKADSSSANFPNDPVGQVKYILEQMEKTFSQAGYTKDNIVSVNWCVTKDVSYEQTLKILKVWEEYIADVETKPSGGTWKRIHGLISPDVLVELEMILAR
jgi:enamine deaminase RidA (YjgF/YER057c/UK114 family)